MAAAWNRNRTAQGCRIVHFFNQMAMAGIFLPATVGMGDRDCAGITGKSLQSSGNTC
jgi:hypothetical protein